MPRPKKIGGPEPKRRSRNGCWPCKGRKVKCGEEKPRCLNCERQGETCDYSIRLNWGGRTKKSRDDAASLEGRSATASPHFATFAAAAEEAITGRPSLDSGLGFFEFTGPKSHLRNRSTQSAPGSAHGSRHGSPLPGSPLPGSPLPGSPLPGELPFTARPTSHPSVGTSASGLPMDPRLSTLQFDLDYPSPLDSPGGVVGTAHLLNRATMRSSPVPGNMLPPFPKMSAPLGSPTGMAGFLSDPQLPPMPANKRARLSPQEEAGSALYSLKQDLGHLPLSGPACFRDVFSSHMANLAPLTPFSETDGTPRTSASSATSDDIVHKLNPIPALVHPPERRVSVVSLLVDNSFDDHHDLTGFKHTSRQYPLTNELEGVTTYGYDLGLPDLDTPKNDDLNAIRLFSPLPGYRTNPFGSSSEASSETELGKEKEIAFEPGGYYAEPVAIKIAKDLEPLPARLMENPINLLYFHHFLNHTARMLVPNDCEENPFRKVLPHMAVHDENLLNILLAYSASHRAHLLSHPPPSNRIAAYVENVFPHLRKSLETQDISTSTLSTAIMLASLEIVAPNTFGIQIPWRTHLSIARQMIIARGPQPIHREDKALFFLNRWFSYLDVLGSLSGCKTESPIAAGYWASTPSVVDDEDDYQIDCLFGYTGRFVTIIARIAELVKRVEAQRVMDNGEFDPNWKPSEDIVAAAEELKARIREGREHVVKGCPHRRKGSSTSTAGWMDPQECADNWDAMQLFSANEAFHWAGYIHLTQRVLAQPKEDPDVQTAVKQIVGALYKVKKGGSAEACLLFAMFTAGVYSVEDKVRERIMERLGGAAGFGMDHFVKARSLMQKVWDTGKNWESLVEDEFFG